MRDDFKKSIKEILAKRVGLLCSNPECRTLTVGPNSQIHKTTNIGVAAHITAASPDGPRFDLNMNSEQRSSIINAIWLCQSCAKLIDSDEIKYTIELLNNWKNLAETFAESQLSKNNSFQNDNRFNKVFCLMPELINEMNQDLKNNPLSREFIIISKNWLYQTSNKILVYYFEDHENLDEKIKLLENNGFVNNITYNNTDRYIFTEEFIDLLTILKKDN